MNLVEAGPRAGIRGEVKREMRRAGIVALNTFREAVRDRVLYNLVFFALLIDGAAVVVGLDFDRDRRERDREPGVERDFGDRASDFGLHRRGTGLQGDGEAHAVCTAGQAGAALGVFAGENSAA